MCKEEQGYYQSQIDPDVAAQLESARAEIAHWKNNHATEVRRARILKERTDMPIERVAAYEQWGKDQRQLAAEQAKNAGLLDFIARAQVSSGVCCCGETIDGHSSPMSCGHSPVDMWDHAVRKLLDAPSDTSALEAIVKKAGEVMRDQALLALSANRAWTENFKAIRALPAVTLEDLK